jgi:hypothetical protein
MLVVSGNVSKNLLAHRQWRDRNRLCGAGWARRMIRFSDDDPGYLAWIAAHPNGFVLNVRRPPENHCVVLHRANCKSISNPTYEPNALTGRKHHKICASSEAEFKLAPKSEGWRDGTFSKRCGFCRPWTWEISDGRRASSLGEAPTKYDVGRVAFGWGGENDHRLSRGR